MVVGVDSKLVVMKHSGSSFKSALGPVVKYDGSYEEFEEVYNNALQEAFEESEYERKNNTYKSYELMQQFA